MEDTKTITLHKPLTKGLTAPVTELNLVEPNAGQMSKAFKDSQGNGVDMTLALLMYTTGTPLAALKTLSARDFNACADFLASFTAPDVSESEASNTAED